MPIECSKALRLHDQEQFHAVDRQVMRLAFDIHNEFGRFPEERIFQTELAHRCRESRMEAWQEMAIPVVHNSFLKMYYTDLVVNQGVIYELKALAKLVKSNHLQVLHYLLLAEQRHGKVLNFRRSSVEYHFVSTSLTHNDRREFELDCDDWIELDAQSAQLLSILSALLSDGGAFLRISLYREALIHFFGGEEKVCRPVEVSKGGRALGPQRMTLLNAETAFHISAASTQLDVHENHVTRLLRHTKLRAIQWLNLNKHQISMKTLQQDA